MKADDANRLKELEREIALLNRRIAEQAVDQLMASFKLSQRRACAVIERLLSTQRLQALLTREVHVVTQKRVQRLCGEEGIGEQTSRFKRAHLAISTTPADPVQAKFPNHVWAADFASDQTVDARVQNFLAIAEELTEIALAIEVDRSITDADLVRIRIGSPPYVGIRCAFARITDQRRLATRLLTATGSVWSVQNSSN